ncbi:MAG: hypothetical protein LBT11_03325 [Treponema sp.]|jgi:hypothetical protein|nr:hypothetical protein [Treponema sp.]
MDKRWALRIIIPLGLLLVLAVPGLVFWGRAPVILVSDAAFDLLYGAERAAWSRTLTALRLWRAVKMVLVPEEGGMDLAVYAIAAVEERPYCVLFPYRYAEEARFFINLYPDVPVAVLDGRRRFPEDEGLAVFRADTSTDFYRAGRAAALLAGDQEPVLVYADGLTVPADREAFDLGLRDGGYAGESRYVGYGVNPTVLEHAACIVYAGISGEEPERILDIPVILFSWIDPALTASNVKLIFDDSPWALVVGAVKALDVEARDQGPVHAPSAATLPEKERRLPERDLRGAIEGALTLFLPESP